MLVRVPSARLLGAVLFTTCRATVRLKEHLVGVYRGVKAARTFQFDQVAESQGSTEALFGSHVKPLVEKALKVGDLSKTERQQ
jgi:hypothetical protein